MKALRLDITFQALLERAIKSYLSQESLHQAKKLVFKDKDLGTPLDQLDREAIYAD